MARKKTQIKVPNFLRDGDPPSDHKPLQHAAVPKKQQLRAELCSCIHRLLQGSRRARLLPQALWTGGAGDHPNPVHREHPQGPQVLKVFSLLAPSHLRGLKGSFLCMCVGAVVMASLPQFYLFFVGGGGVRLSLCCLQASVGASPSAAGLLLHSWLHDWIC